MFSFTELFQVDVLPARSGVVLDLATAGGGTSRRAPFCCCFKGFVTFSGSPSQGHGVRSGLVLSTSPVQCQRVLFERTKGGRKGHLRHRVSCRRTDVHILTFLCTVVCSILTDQTWKPPRPDLTSHPSVQSVKEDQTVSMTVQLKISI